MDAKNYLRILACACLVAAAGCGDDGMGTDAGRDARPGDAGTGDARTDGGAAVPFGTATDVRIGKALWATINQGGMAYRSWQLFPGTTANQPASTEMPHGATVTIYWNGTGTTPPTTFPADTVIVKDGFDMNGALTAVTVMENIAGYDPDNNNWFWASFASALDGTFNTTATGTPVVGRVGKGTTTGCIGCHLTDKNGDLVFSNDP